MIFTSENGEKWEEMPDSRYFDNALTIRPVQLKPKWKVSLEEYTDLNTGGIWIDLDRIETPKATAIKEAVEALLEYVYSPGVKNMDTLRQKSMDAAHAFQKGADNDWETEPLSPEEVLKVQIETDKEIRGE